MTDCRVDVVVEDDRWAGTALGTVAVAACSGVLKALDLPCADYEVALLACNDARIGLLNAEFRDQATATNILSWPARPCTPGDDGQAPAPPGRAPGEGPVFLGDMAMAYETCLREAERQDIPPTDHMTHLLVHGCLHLLGYDHVLEKQAAVMEELEVAILAKLGIANPY
ncbi:MAG: rRNA maturation RNase YbeY [Paracoccaceae bacterium]